MQNCLLPVNLNALLGGRSSSKKKTSIRFRGEPLLSFLEHSQTVNGRKKWHFVVPTDLSVPSVDTQSSTVTSVATESDASLVQSLLAVSPVGAESDIPPALPDFRPASDASFTLGSMD